MSNEITNKSSARDKSVGVKQKAVRQFLEQTLAQKKMKQQQMSVGVTMQNSDLLSREMIQVNLVHQSNTAQGMHQSAMATGGFQTAGSITGQATGYGYQSAQGAKPSTQGGTVSMAHGAAGNRMNQTLYSNTMRQKNLTFNRSNIANIYLNKKGQAVQVTLKN